METIKVDYYSETCCDSCGDVIHNHFDCPNCEDVKASTSLYGEIDSDDKSFECEECGAEYELIDWDAETLTIKKIEDNNNKGEDDGSN